MSSDDKYEKSWAGVDLPTKARKEANQNSQLARGSTILNLYTSKLVLNVSDLKRGQNEPLKSARSCLKTGEPANFKIGRSFPLQEYQG